MTEAINYTEPKSKFHKLIKFVVLLFLFVALTVIVILATTEFLSFNLSGFIDFVLFIFSPAYLVISILLVLVGKIKFKLKVRNDLFLSWLVVLGIVSLCICSFLLLLGLSVKSLDI